MNFFENHLPILLTALFSIVGSVVMLLTIEFWSGVLALAIVVAFLAVMPHYVKVNDRLYFRLNSRLENEVNQIERAGDTALGKHYSLVERLRIRISNREALSFLAIGCVLALLFDTTMALLIAKQTQNAGHIYAVLTYLWSFAFSLDDIPHLTEQLSNLQDIGRRMRVGGGEIVFLRRRK